MVAPKFYDETKIGSVYAPRFELIKGEAEKSGLTASSKDDEKVALVGIDQQVGFCHKTICGEPNPELYVDGAEMDIANTNRFIMENMDKISRMFFSLDTHFAFQIFFSSWWVDKDGNHPAPFTIITAEMVENGEYRPLIDPVGSIDYVKKLKAQSNLDLMIWTFHTMEGTIGRILDPSLYELAFYHSIARRTQITFLAKGIIPQSEMYGILSPEVEVPSHPQGRFNTTFLGPIMKHDKVVIVGEAKSHCVLASIRQIFNYFNTTDPDVLKKIYILEDCMSSVVHPQVDFEAIAQAEFDKFKKGGMNIIKSTDLEL